MYNYLINKEMLSSYLIKTKKILAVQIIIIFITIITIITMILSTYKNSLLCAILFFILSSFASIIVFVYLDSIKYKVMYKYNLFYQLLTGVTHEVDVIVLNISNELLNNTLFLKITTNKKDYYLLSELSINLSLNEEYKFLITNKYIIGYKYDENK